MPPPVVCYECGKPMLPSYHRTYCSAIEAGLTPPEALYDLKPKLRRDCCRDMILTNMTLVDDHHALVEASSQQTISTTCPKQCFELAVYASTPHFQHPLSLCQTYDFRPDDLRFPLIRKAFLALLEQDKTSSSDALQIVLAHVDERNNHIPELQQDLFCQLYKTLRAEDYCFSQQCACTCDLFRYLTANAIVPQTQNREEKGRRIEIRMEGRCYVHDFMQRWSACQESCVYHKKHCAICGQGISNLAALVVRTAENGFDHAWCEECASRKDLSHIRRAWDDIFDMENKQAKRIFLLRHRAFRDHMTNSCLEQQETSEPSSKRLKL